LGPQLGLRELIEGTGLSLLVMVKLAALEVPPLDVGLVTVTANGPDDAMAAAEMAAVIWVELTNVVAGAAEPKFTVEAATKFVPLTVRVKAGPPAAVLLGETDVIVGVELEDGGGLFND
jgi:hypothetical protein